MKYTVTFLLASFVFNYQAQIEKIRMAKFEIETKATAGFNIFPTFLNVFENDYSNQQTFQNGYNYAIAARADIIVYPIVTDYFSYGFQSHGMLGWLGNNSQNEFGFGHQFRAGIEQLKLQINFDHIQFRRLFTASLPINMPTDESFTYGLSRYDDIKNFKIGPHFTFKKEQTLTILFDKETFLVNDKPLSSPGFYAEYMNQNKISWFISFHKKHAVNGLYFLSSPNNNPTNPEAISFQVGLRKTFLYSKRYYEMNKNFDTN